MKNTFFIACIFCAFLSSIAGDNTIINQELLSNATCDMVDNKIGVEFRELVKKHDLDVAIKRMFMSKNGELIIELKETDVFSQEAHLIVLPDQIDQLRIVVTNLGSIIRIHKKKTQIKKLRLIKFSSQDRAKVEYENDD